MLKRTLIFLQLPRIATAQWIITAHASAVTELLLFFFLLRYRRLSSGGKGISWGKACLIKLPLHHSASRAPHTLKRLWSQSSNLDCSESPCTVVFNSQQSCCECVYQWTRATHNSSATSQCKCGWLNRERLCHTCFLLIFVGEVVKKVPSVSVLRDQKARQSSGLITTNSDSFVLATSLHQDGEVHHSKLFQQHPLAKITFLLLFASFFFLNTFMKFILIIFINNVH